MIRSIKTAPVLLALAVPFLASAGGDYAGEGSWGNRELGYGCGDGADKAMNAMIADLGGNRLGDFAVDWAYIGMVDGKRIDCKAHLMPGAAHETFRAPRREFSFTDERSGRGTNESEACGKAESQLMYWSKYKTTKSAESGYDADSIPRITYSTILDREVHSGTDMQGKSYAECRISRRFYAIEIYYLNETAVAEGAGATLDQACDAANAVAEKAVAEVCAERGLLLNHWWSGDERTKEAGGKALCRVSYRANCLEKGGR